MKRKTVPLDIALIVGVLITTLLFQVTGCAGERRLPAGTPTSTPTVTLEPPTPTLKPTPTETSSSPTFVPTSCAFEIPEDAVIKCGLVRVPENRNLPLTSTETISVSVAVYRSPRETLASDPVVFLQGGPGSPAIEWTTYFYQEFVAPILKRHDFIVLDQRGAGLSEPLLDCPALKMLYLQDMQQNFSAIERETRYTEVLQACRDRLTSDGVDLSAYTSVASAADVRDVVRALGYEQINLYGISYGTRWAQVVMRDYPELVRSAVLDSALPLNVRLYDETIPGIDRALAALFDDCAADPACDAAYPELETEFRALVEQLDSQPITVTATSPFNGQPYDITVSGSTLTTAIEWALHSPAHISLIPQAIHDIHHGDYTYLEHHLSLPLETYADLALGLKMSVDCHEQILVSTPADLQAELYGGGDVLFDICNTWGAAPFDPQQSKPLVSDTPTLILAGEYDPTTPATFGRQIHENLRHSYFFEFPERGHAPSIGAADSCPLEIVLTFLDDPASDPDSACIAEMEGSQFVVPFTGAEEVTFESFTSDEYGVRGIIPEGWQAIGEGFYNRQASALDPTQLGIQSASVSAEEWVAWLSDQFQYTGFDADPMRAGEYNANGLTWTLYTAKFKEHPVDMALAERNGSTLLVVMLSQADERDALYEAVYLPVIDALKPID